MFVVNVHLSLLPSNSSPAGNHHQPAALSTVLKVCWFGMATSHEIHESCLWRVWSGQSGPQAFPNTIDTLRILSATWGQLGCFNLFQSAHLHFSLNHDQFWAFPPHWRDEACHESQGKCWPSLWLIVSSIQPVKPLSDKIWQVIYIQHHSTSFNIKHFKSSPSHPSPAPAPQQDGTSGHTTSPTRPWRKNSAVRRSSSVRCSPWALSKMARARSRLRHLRRFQSWGKAAISWNLQYTVLQYTNNV